LDLEIAGQILKEAVVLEKEPAVTVDKQSIARPIADDGATSRKSSGENSSLPGKIVTDPTQTTIQPAKTNLLPDAGTAPNSAPSLPKDAITASSDLKIAIDPDITNPADPAALKQEQAVKSLPQPADVPATKPLITKHNTEQLPGRQLPLISPEISKPESIMNQARDAAAQPAKPPTQFEPPDSQTLPVIRQQLEMLNSRQFVWQGEAWQGQQMKWTIRGDEHQRKAPSARSWDTELRLELPGLGTIAAAITVTGKQVRLSVSAVEADSAEMMEKHRQRLIDGMESGGLSLVGMEVKHEPAP
jgi:hypothetical protein